MEGESCALVSHHISLKTKGGTKMDFQNKTTHTLKAGGEKKKMNKSFTCTLLHAITHAYSKIGYLTLSTAVSLPGKGMMNLVIIDELSGHTGCHPGPSLRTE